MSVWWRMAAVSKSVTTQTARTAAAVEAASFWPETAGHATVRRQHCFQHRRRFFCFFFC